MNLIINALKNKAINRISILIVLSGFIILFVINCSDKTINSAEEIVFPETNVSYQSHVKPFMAYNCATIACHHPNTQAGSRYFDDYISLKNVNNAGLIINGDPDKSRLCQILEGKSITHIQYLSIYTITTNHIAGVRQWIKEGALNN